MFDKAKRLEAARLIWINSRPMAEAKHSNGSHLADPANHEEAYAAYVTALNLLWGRSELKDVRRALQEAGYTLNLYSKENARG